MKVGEAIRIISSSLANIYDELEAKNIAYMMIGHILNITKIKILSSYDTIIESDFEEKILKSLDELKTHKPLQYVLGSALFCDCRINVCKDVLIPRPETEELVQLIINDHKNKHQKIKILDIGTGSGCIAIALKKNLPNYEVHAIEISEPALLVAKENALNNKTQIFLHHFDVLDTLKWTSVNDFDIIVCNPPYVMESEKVLMKKNVLDHEPALALFVPNDDPLKFYKAVLRFADRYLKSDGMLYFEINEDLAEATAEIFKNREYSNIVIKNDFNGRQRFLTCI
ncbi:MAG: peptide chain release factor N(5)-glutamine methyltransferase [Bacteroidota bacterium]